MPGKLSSEPVLYPRVDWFDHHEENENQEKDENGKQKSTNKYERLDNFTDMLSLSPFPIKPTVFTSGVYPGERGGGWQEFRANFIIHLKGGETERNKRKTFPQINSLTIFRCPPPPPAVQWLVRPLVHLIPHYQRNSPDIPYIYL